MKLLAVLLVCTGSIAIAAESTSTTAVPKKKQTTLGLYATAAQGYEKWKAAPEKIKVIMLV